MQICPTCGATNKRADTRVCYRCATSLQLMPFAVSTTTSTAAPLGDLVLGIDAAKNHPVSFPFDQRVRGTYIIGLNGTGKTTLIESMVVQDIRAGQGLCLLDPHGD